MPNSEEHDRSNENNSNGSGRDDASAPLATFGMITDIQYADVEDGTSFDKKQRYYRNSLNLVREAVKNWRAYSQKHGLEIKFIIQLGDLIDGKCKAKSDSERAMNLLIEELSKLFEDKDDKKNADVPRLLHIWGNHEFYNFKRQYLLNSPLNTARQLNQNIGHI